MRTNNSTTPISSTQEDYLRTIYLLTKRNETVSVTNIAERLNLSKSTVSERLKGLAKAKLIKQEHYGTITLTSKGEGIGRKVTHKHRIIEVFLHDTLGMPDKDIHDEADSLEHALSDSVVKRLSEFLGHPTEDPHGSEIPSLEKN